MKKTTNTPSLKILLNDDKAKHEIAQRLYRYWINRYERLEPSSQQKKFNIYVAGELGIKQPNYISQGLRNPGKEYDTPPTGSHMEKIIKAMENLEIETFFLYHDLKIEEKVPKLNKAQSKEKYIETLTKYNDNLIKSNEILLKEKEELKKELETANITISELSNIIKELRK